MTVKTGPNGTTMEKINVADQKGSILAPLKTLNYMLKKTDTLTFAFEVKDASTPLPTALLSWRAAGNQGMLLESLFSTFTLFAWMLAEGLTLTLALSQRERELGCSYVLSCVIPAFLRLRGDKRGNDKETRRFGCGYAALGELERSSLCYVHTIPKEGKQ